MRYNRAFKSCLSAILCWLAFTVLIVAFCAVSKIQYNRLVLGMESLEATIVDIDLDIHVRGPNEQEIYIEYEVDGTVYTRELQTDTEISFAAGTGAHYSVGDKIQIFYDPQNPEIIASPRSQSVGNTLLIFALFSMAFLLAVLCVMMKSRHKFRVTQEEYEKEGEALKKRKQEEKRKKKQAKLEWRNRHPVANKIRRCVLFLLGVLSGLVILLGLLGQLLRHLGR